LSALKHRLRERFAGKAVTIAEIERFVVVETAFRETHYKAVLKSMEVDTGELRVVQAPAKRKRGTFGDPNMIVQID
jgi:hypothetical protein